MKGRPEVPNRLSAIILLFSRLEVYTAIQTMDHCLPIKPFSDSCRSGSKPSQNLSLEYLLTFQWAARFTLSTERR